MRTDQLRIKNPRDVVSGLLLVAIGAFVLWNTGELAGMQGFVFGPRTMPRLIAWLLICVGGLITLQGVFRNGPKGEEYSLQGIVVVSASIAVFWLSITVLGLILTSFATVLVAAFATREVRWRESLVLALLASAFTAVAFVVLLNLPINLWPWP